MMETKPNSKDYLVGLNMESELKKYANNTGYTMKMSDDFSNRVQSFIREQTYIEPEEVKYEEEGNITAQNSIKDIAYIL